MVPAVGGNGVRLGTTLALGKGAGRGGGSGSSAGLGTGHAGHEQFQVVNHARPARRG